MIRIKDFQPNSESLIKQFEKDYLSSFDRSADKFNPLHYSYKNNMPDFYSQKDKCIDIALKGAKTEEIWINQSEISKMEVKRLIDGQHFINLTMKDGSAYKVEGSSIQEFFMKNVILGGDIN